MNRERPDITRRVKDQKAAGQNAVFKAVLIYENFATGVRARRFFQALARASDKVLAEQMWDFEVLGIREARNAAAGAARKADVVAVSVSGQMDLPGTVRAWFDMWLWLLEDENPALMALFDSSATPNIASIRAYLNCIARRAGIEFFLAHRQVSLVAVVRSKEEEIWPKCVERALLSWLKLRKGD
jgi:hypothetical protein